jgi:tetratricopeptide (TPR) repeat protein
LAAAGDYYQKGLAIRKRVYGEKHQETAHSLFVLGRLQRMQEKWDEAQHNLEQALAVYLESQGEEYYLTASCLNELGAVFLGKQELTSAHSYLERALTIRQKLYPAEHPFIANTLQNLGLVLLAQATTDGAKAGAAEAVLLQALQMGQQRGDPENLRAAETLEILGRVAASRHHWQEARQYYTRSHAIYQHLLGEQNPLTQKVARALSDLQSAEHTAEHTEIANRR